MVVIPRLAERAEGPPSCNMRYRENIARIQTENAQWFAEAIQQL